MFESDLNAEVQTKLGQMKKSFKKLLIGLGIAALSIGSGAPAIAAEESDELKVVEQRLLELGANSEQVPSLINKLANGQPLDSMTGVAPTSTVTTRIGNNIVTDSTYSDGSVSRSIVESPDMVVQGKNPRIITGCSYRLSAGVATYSNCVVSHDNGSVKLGFIASYYRSASGAAVSSFNPYSWSIIAYLGTCQFHSFGKRTNADLQLRTFCQFGSPPFAYSTYFALELNVRINGASTSFTQ